MSLRRVSSLELSAYDLASIGVCILLPMRTTNALIALVWCTTPDMRVVCRERHLPHAAHAVLFRACLRGRRHGPRRSQQDSRMCVFAVVATEHCAELLRLLRASLGSIRTGVCYLRSALAQSTE
jgi:hypothetical protein